MNIEALIDLKRGFVFGEWHYENGGSYGPLRGAYVSLLIIHSGVATVTFDGQERVVVAGECAVIVNRLSLMIRYQKYLRTHVSWCEAHPAAAPRDGAAPEVAIARKLRISDNLLQLQRMGVALGLDSGSSLNAFRNALGDAIFGAYLFESKVSEEERRVPAGPLRVRRHLDAHFADNCTLTQLANIAALTPNHLVVAFRKAFGTTPIRHLWLVRATQARQLLLHTGLSQGEIAFRCGYKSPYHFSRHIKQLFSQSPSVLRENKGYRLPSNESELVNDIAF